jgi:hypothetical protein
MSMGVSTLRWLVMLRPVRGGRSRGELIASPQFNSGIAQAMNHNLFIDCHETRELGAATIPCTIMLFASSYLDYTNCVLAILRFTLAFHVIPRDWSFGSRCCLPDGQSSIDHGGRSGNV